MTRFTYLLAAGLVALAAPAAAQYDPNYYPQPYPQPYPNPYQPYPDNQYPYPGYPQGGGVVESIIDSLIGNQYNMTDRRAIHTCGRVAIQRAAAQFGGYANPYGGNQPYGGNYNNNYGNGYNGFNGYPGNMRVVAINSVQRRSGGLRVTGLIDSGLYRNRMRTPGDLSFRCDVNYNGYVSNIRVDRNLYR